MANWYLQDVLWDNVSNWTANIDGTGANPATVPWTTAATAADNLLMGDDYAGNGGTVSIDIILGHEFTITGTCNIDFITVDAGGIVHNGTFTGLDFAINSDGHVSGSTLSNSCTVYSGGTIAGGNFTSLENQGIISDGNIALTVSVLLTNNGTVDSGIFNEWVNNATINNGTFNGDGGVNASGGVINTGIIAGDDCVNNGTIYSGEISGTGFFNDSSIFNVEVTGSISNAGTLDGVIISGTGSSSSGYLYYCTVTGSSFTNSGTISESTISGSGFVHNGGTLDASVTVSGINAAINTGVVNGSTFTGKGLLIATTEFNAGNIQGDATHSIFRQNVISFTGYSGAINIYNAKPNALDVLSTGLN